MAAYDVIVIGLGAMGSAAVRALAGRGRRVLGVDRFDPPHDRGSSHGRTRIIRETYFEHPVYVPLVRRAYELWEELERESGRQLWRQTGAVALGPAEGTVVAGARLSARTHGLAHEELTAVDLRRRWPAFAPPQDVVGLFEARAGLLFPERCVAAALERARAAGATLHTNERVSGWEKDGTGFVVRTEEARYSAGALVLAAGPWVTELLPGLDLPLTVERQVVHWFEGASDPESLRAGRCPIVLWEYAPEKLFYTTPDVGDGLKAAIHHEGEPTAPDAVRPAGPDDESVVRGLLARLFPCANGRLREVRTCLYSNAPDDNFVIDRHPEHAQVVIASPCSGHGFKFASAIGEIVADLVMEGASRFDLAPFALARLMSPRQAARNADPT